MECCLHDLKSCIGTVNESSARFLLPLRHEVGDLSCLGSGERFAVAIATKLMMGTTWQERELHSGEAEGPRGPSERERASHWVGVR
jgi:hypothetical protein